MSLDAEGNLTDRSRVGHHASGVPGSIMGLWDAHQRFGIRRWADLIEPAIALAEEGFLVNERLGGRVRRHPSVLRQFERLDRAVLPRR
jgi:gamma-glutamyltranspeptidase / glutathione hydrolase